MINILPTLDFVHRQQVIHRDIKPSNLIRRASDRKIVLIDFGAVKEVSNQPISQLGHTSSLVIGSPYMPNEQYSGKTMFASDIYAIGIIAVQALTGLLPNQIPEDPLTSEFCWRDRATVTPTLADVIDKMVRYDFRQRYQSANEVIDALQPLLRRSLAHTIFSEVTPPLIEELPLVPDSPKSIIDILNDILIEEVSDDLEMSEDPIRAKKLVCLVCTGILENDLKRLNNFSFGELLQDLYQQYSTLESLKESLVKAVKTIAIQKQHQYLIVAKIVFNAASKLYKQLPSEDLIQPENPVESSTNPSLINPQITYSVNHLVINAGSAQLIAPINNSENNLSKEAFDKLLENELLLDQSFEPNEDADIYEWVAHEINTDAQQIRLKKLLFYAYQDIWESDLHQLNSVNWASFLRELVSFMPTFSQLASLIQEAIQRVSKPQEYLAIGNLLLTKLEQLYPDRDANLDNAIAPHAVPALNQPSSRPVWSDRKIPFDSKIADNLLICDWN